MSHSNNKKKNNKFNKKYKKDKKKEEEDDAPLNADEEAVLRLARGGVPKGKSSADRRAQKQAERVSLTASSSSH